jgi:hypothetical protein
MLSTGIAAIIAPLQENEPKVARSGIATIIAPLQENEPKVARFSLILEIHGAC